MAFDMVQDLKSLKNLPDRWRVLNFDEVIEDNTRNADKIQKNDYLENGKIAIVDQGQNLVAGYSNDEANAYNKYPLIIFGDHTRILKYIDFPIYLGADGTKLLDVKKEISDTKYVYYFLKTLNIPNTGYNRHFKYLKDIRIPLPPLDIQKKIADSLDKAQELIDKRKEQISALDKFIENLFLDMFGDPVSNPMGWEEFSGKDVFDKSTVGIVITPAKYYRDKGIPALRSLNIRKNKIVLENLVYFSEEDNNLILQKSKLKENDILIVRTGQPGTAAVVKKDMEGFNCIDVLITHPKESSFNSQFIAFFINKKKEYIVSQSRGQIQKHFNVGMLNDLLIYSPPLDLQNQFAFIVEKVEAEKTKLEASLTEMENNFNSIIQRAFKGELF